MHPRLPSIHVQVPSPAESVGISNALARCYLVADGTHMTFFYSSFPPSYHIPSPGLLRSGSAPCTTSSKASTDACTPASTQRLSFTDRHWHRKLVVRDDSYPYSNRCVCDCDTPEIEITVVVGGRSSPHDPVSRQSGMEPFSTALAASA